MRVSSPLYLHKLFLKNVMKTESIDYSLGARLKMAFLANLMNSPCLFDSPTELEKGSCDIIVSIL